MWRDGRVTATERLLTEEIRRLLEVPPKEHSRLEAEIVERLANEATDAEALYRRTYARSLERGLVDAGGRDVLEILRRELGLSLRQVKEIEESV